ncbi:flagellar biosynthesis protein FlhA [Halothermothrix orenii]|uniref:Flagellar biosynthesis protein FlhA n=1 Tax=Halothermothrix orenii (strain H 168 / OCM 544 / DSM 9562) TaxID=373903 RepID=B8CYP9_HALOH|nr:flagellar biosynthesis protein FlhA [Halothermothrix orenii]ACL70418.1 flagellar biosynthesis protein FlhA [Halothermothrix orenii H 168]
MPALTENTLLNKISKNTDIVFAILLVGIIMMFIIPLPTVLMDILLATNITFSMVVILVTIYITDPLEFSVFPSLLLFATVYRLSLNISTTRLILTHGYAGKIIMSFGDFVVGGNYVVGLIMFIIIVVIQFVVITKGAERVSEVAARFTLDAMPGKQMSIDADLNAGIIDEREAQRQRELIRQEADFYGAMDGASKFVKGDAIAGIIITFINIIGGLIVGVLQQGLPLAQAAQTYTLLTVGDGLVTQIPALLISTATGLVVTRAASESSMGREFSGQLTAQPKALWIASGVLAILGLAPGLPTLPFFILSGIVGGVGYVMNLQLKSREQREAKPEEETVAPKRPEKEELNELIKVDPIEVEVGYNLISLVLPEQGGDFLDRVAMIRRQTAMELGIIIPPVRILDNLQLEPNVYRIKLQGVEISRYEILPDHYLAMDSGITTKEIKGIETKEPAFGTPAIWITERQKEEAELSNYTIVDPPSVMATHLTELIRQHAYELLGRQEVKELIDGIKEDYPAVVEELVPDLMNLGEIQKVLQNLLWEGIPIKNLVTILETLADYAGKTKDIQLLTEYVRQSLSRQITSLFTEDDGTLYIINMDSQIEDELSQALEQSDQGRYFTLEPSRAQDLLNKIGVRLKVLLEKGHDPILLTTPLIRRPLKELTYRSFKDLVVLSYNELQPDTKIEVLGTVT